MPLLVGTELLALAFWMALSVLGAIGILAFVLTIALSADQLRAEKKL